jgi:hypothetical protein
MNLSDRRALMVQLGDYIQSDEDDWKQVQQKAYLENRWFVPEFIQLSSNNIARNYLQPGQLEQIINRYSLQDEHPSPRKVGIVMAGNIPLVGFHDLLCVFLTGHYAMVKLSSKDHVLMKHLIEQLTKWDPRVKQYITDSAMIKNCDAYIATGSTNSSRYFEYYFGRYPSIIRKNRTSVAILTGKESKEELDKLSDDVYQYFGLGCRNVTKIFVPKNYNFVPLLEAFRKYNHLSDHHKFKNNYDYNLAIHILNNQYYMTNGSIILVENESAFSPISQLHYEYYSNENHVRDKLKGDRNIQCIVSKTDVDFGGAQCPQVCDYADGVDTIEFLKGLS